MAQQTATQWLRKEISKLGTRSRFYHDVMGLIDEAEKREKKQIIDSFGVGCQVESKRLIGYHGMAQQYYNETYKTQAQ
jgi:hypothetical protein